MPKCISKPGKAAFPTKIGQHPCSTYISRNWISWHVWPASKLRFHQPYYSNTKVVQVKHCKAYYSSSRVRNEEQCVRINYRSSIIYYRHKTQGMNRLVQVQVGQDWLPPASLHIHVTYCMSCKLVGYASIEYTCTTSNTHCHVLVCKQQCCMK